MQNVHANSTGRIPLSAAELGLTRALYSVSETLALLSVGRTTLHYLIKNGELPATKVGKKTLLAAHDIAALVNKRRVSTAQIAEAA